MSKQSKRNAAKVAAVTPGGLPRLGASGTVIARRWRIAAHFAATTNSGVRIALTSLAKAERDAERSAKLAETVSK